MSTAYRFIFTGTRGTDEQARSEIQVGEVNLYDRDGRSILLPGTVAANPSGNVCTPQQSAAKAIDRHLETKWCDGAFKASGHQSTLELRLPSAQAVASYNLWTANDVVFRDPVSWSLEMRTEDGEWATIDEQDDLAPPMERFAGYRISGFPVSASSLVLAGSSMAPPDRGLPLPRPSIWLPPPPPPPVSTSSTVSSSMDSAAVWQQQQQQLLRQDDMQLHDALPGVTPSADSGTASVLLMLVIFAFLSVAILNIAYLWRESISRALRASLDEDQYAYVQDKAERLQDLVQDKAERLRTLATNTWSSVLSRADGVRRDVGGSRVAFTRVACTTATVVPLEVGVFGDDADAWANSPKGAAAIGAQMAPVDDDEDEEDGVKDGVSRL